MRSFRPLICLASLTLVLQPLAARADLTVKIGQVSPLTGELSHIGKDDENGVRLAIEDLNSRKIRIGGQDVTFVLDSQDDAADPKTAVTVAQKLVDDGVAGVVGHANSGTSIPASRIYSAAGVPMITESATNPKLTQQGLTNVFRMVANDVRQGAVIGAYLVRDLGARKIAIVDDRTAYGQGLADEIEKSVKAAGGNVVAREYGTDKTTNWMAILTTIKSRQPEGIAFTGGDTQAAAFVQQAQRLGLKVKLIAGDEACTPQFIKLAGSAMNNDTYCTLAGVPPAKMPQGPEFFKRYQQRFGVPVQLYAPYAYDAVLAMADAMQAAGSTDPKVYLPKLRASKLDGVTGAIQFDEKGDIRNGAITVRQFEAGNWTDKSVVR
ncbi:branched chain amino acid ABC transporter substrate-binding protein [Burkholderia sp. SFA1]|uniref:branched-chain amino acid ABC transporter substrate-binding protein n=1 Tax=Caballeronia sp. CLC5 TaxID=2906764 RepID=UPI0002388C99|nr:branched-chain amino acid ABC transporter substrate-binding protein [Caballeronia sp. CLC5]AET93455.1 Extracellular ligand-binding receptor [Burkholderia sp. YI23]MCE4574049.1 branched-chain amino acid ABC transporter substrate-binding protein [Caballeronia sp. CLC5]BBP99428.1 branched chain amino acid ABC transporter substrate-binding protein [Burkholderia sp. SFA1]